MASSTKMINERRAMKKAKAGARRKAAIRKFGTTVADLPLNKPNAHEAKQKAAAKK
jgi:hypothetical protein